MAEEGKKMKAYKGFNSDMTCRGKQYAENTVYEEPDAELCRAGMHFCENPFDVLKFYDLVSNKGELITTAEVEPLGKVETDGVKSVTTKLRVGAKLSFPAFIKAGVDFLIERTETVVSVLNNNGADAARIGSAGDAAQIGSAGYAAQIGSAGDGAQIGSAGKNSVICCAGDGCVVSAKKGSWITLAEWDWLGDEYTPVCVKTEFVDGERIKEDTPYRLENGVFVEVKEGEQ